VRQKLVIGNWKLHTRRDEAEALARALASTWVADARTGLVVCPPFVHIPAVAAVLADSAIAWGAQNVATQAEGALTGEVSGEMLTDYGCRYAIIGHSERRALFGETNGAVAEKVLRALDAGLIPVLCVGETRAERESNRVESVVGEQLGSVLRAADAARLASLVVAYEPVWAIGTGLTATPAQAQAVHGFIRQQLIRCDAALADVPVLYGGSVKADNAASLFAEQDIDGALVGGASLNASEFLAIGQQALQA
jgi:triosephosphate isomerase